MSQLIADALPTNIIEPDFSLWGEDDFSGSALLGGLGGSAGVGTTVPEVSVARVILARTSGRRFPSTYARQPEGPVVIWNGLDAPIRWDGKSELCDADGVEAPTVAPAMGVASGGAATAGEYTCAYRWIDPDGIPSNLSPTTAVTATAGQKFVWGGLYTPVGRGTQIEIWRSLVGAPNVLYKVATGNFGGYTEPSLSDDTLSLNESLAILLEDGSINANRFGMPPDFRPFVVAHQNRHFSAGLVDYTEGHVEVLAGSNTVFGVGTNFTPDMVGRELNVAGAPRRYEILYVYTSPQALVLTTDGTTAANYGGETDNFASYSIRPAPAYRNSMQWSGAGETDGWLATNELETGEKNDEITGMFARAGFVYLTFKRSLFYFNYGTDPLNGECLPTGVERGCENNRLRVDVEGSVYLMDRDGVHRYSGGSSTDPVSGPIEDVFRAGLNWEASTFWHAAHSPTEKCVKFFCLGGPRYPTGALVFNYRTNGWSTESFGIPISSSTIAIVGGRQRLVGGSSYQRMVLLDEGSLDGTTGAGVVRGFISAATYTSITDSAATHPADVVGASVAIVEGRGKGQVRGIVASADGTLSIDSPWLILPDTSEASPTRSSYQIGGFRWRVKLGTYRYADFEKQNPRSLTLTFTPCKAACSVDALVYQDHNELPDNRGVTLFGESTFGEPGIRFDLANKEGWLQMGAAGGQDEAGASHRSQAIELRGFSHAERQRIHRLEMAGVVNDDQ